MIFCKTSLRKNLSNQQITVGNTTLKRQHLCAKLDDGLKFSEEVKNIFSKSNVAFRTLSFIAQKLTVMTR